MKLVEALDSDQEELRIFFESFVAPGRIDLDLKRHGHFFDFYNIQSDEFKVYLLKGDDGQTLGMTSISFREGYIDGKPEKIGFARDLRVAQERQAQLAWSKTFLPALEEELAKNHCRFFFSVINQKQARSYNSVLRPRRRQQLMPRYYLLRRFDLVALHGRLPLLFNPLDSIEVQPAKEEDLSSLVSFMDRHAKDRPLAPVFEESSFKETLKAWPGLNLDSFLVAKDSNGKIVGCCAPWELANAQESIVRRHQRTAGLVRKLFTWGSLFGLTRRLSKVGEPLQVTFLTHAFADNPDIFFSLLYRAWKTTPKNQTLLYPHYQGEIKTLPPHGFIYTKTPYAAYTILPPHQKLPNFLRPRLQSPPPYFEPALI